MKKILFALAFAAAALSPFVTRADNTDWNEPNLDTLYSVWPEKVHDLARTCAMMDFDGDTDIPNDAIRYNRATDLFEEYDSGGSTWASFPIANEVSTLADNSVTSATIVNGTIVSADIAPTTITASNIANNTITATQIANTTITATQIANTTITNAQIASGTINSTNIADGTIATADIGNAQITGAKLANSALSLVATYGPATTSSSTSTRFLLLPNGGDGDTPSASSNIFTRVIIPAAMRIVAISAYCANCPGDATLTLYKNGSSTGQSLSGVSTAEIITAPFSTDYAANDYLDVTIANGNGSLPLDITVFVWGRPL